jgi:histidine triad (HIT) family protein
MDDCIFCKIVAGSIPAEKVFEDEATLAFIDIKPVSKGHVLVIPKAHHANLHELPENLLCHLSLVLKKVAGGVQKAMEAEGINIGMNNGAAAGQLIFHAHFHVIPRKTDDGLKSWGSRAYENGEMEKIAEIIGKFL